MSKCDAPKGPGCSGCHRVIEIVVDKGFAHFKGEEFVEDKNYPASEPRVRLIGHSSLLLDASFPARAVGLTDELTCTDRQRRAIDIAGGLVTSELAPVNNLVVLPVDVDFTRAV